MKHMELFNEESLVADTVADADADTFEKIYDYYFPRIYKYIRFRVGDPHLTDDLTSQVFENALNKLDKYNSQKGKFAAWLFAIAHNTVVDYFRKKKNNLCTYEDIEKLIDTTFDVEKACIAKEFRTKLFQALNSLSERERNIIGLKFWAGLTNRKIASLMGLSENNIGIIIYRSIIRLRVALQDLGVNTYE
ncbi:MAG: hypothetical protein APF84_09790 [Gracilibacter sp. BRH_c7a]|nr:MAG: hypothetical protein APF84_09790 [Gracilibacter sp. BRH_c7a]